MCLYSWYRGKSSSSPSLVILSAYWHRIALLCGMTVRSWWHVLTHRLKLPSQGSGNSSPPAGWQQRTHTAPVPDVAVGATNEAAVTLQTEAQSWSQKPHSFPIVRSSVPATPGAPPEVFVEAKMELWAAIRAWLTLELRARERQYWLILWLVVQWFADSFCRCLFT